MICERLSHPHLNSPEDLNLFLTLHLEYIFERFYRVEKSRNRDTGGAGLGLAIVKKIADTHGWKIEAESTINVGSTFKILFL